MPPKSRNQAVAAAIAEKVKKGQAKPTLGQPSTKMAKMTSKQLGDFTQGPLGNLPKKVKKSKGGY
jgi:hypothetical protein